MSSAPRLEAQDRRLLPTVEVIGDERFDAALGRRSLDRSLSKGERTRYLVLAHVARQLLETLDRTPTIEGVLEETGLSRGTFYNYFGDMDECIVVLLSAFMESLSRERVSGNKDPEADVVYASNLWYCSAYSLNAGLFAAFSRVSSETSTLLLIREEINAEWVERVVRSTGRRRGRSFAGHEKRAFAGEVRLLCAMSIEALRERNVHRDPLLLSSYPDVESMARGLTAVWRRTISHYENSSLPGAARK